MSRPPSPQTLPYCPKNTATTAPSTPNETTMPVQVWNSYTRRFSDRAPSLHGYTTPNPFLRPGSKRQVITQQDWDLAHPPLQPWQGFQHYKSPAQNDGVASGISSAQRVCSVELASDLRLRDSFCDSAVEIQRCGDESVKERAIRASTWSFARLKKTWSARVRSWGAKKQKSLGLVIEMQQVEKADSVHGGGYQGQRVGTFSSASSRSGEVGEQEET